MTTAQSQQDKAVAIVATATSNYMASHPDATEQELDSLQFKILEGLKISRYRANNRVARAKVRRTLSDRATLEARELGLTVRNFRTVLIDLSFLRSQEFDPVSCSALQIHPRGGFTIAYRKDEGSVLFSAAICRDDEVFDKLEGRILAVTRFSQGLRLECTEEEFEKGLADVKILEAMYMAFLRQQSTQAA